VAKQDYSFEVIDAALSAFCMEGGRKQPVERLLDAAGLDIPFSTLRGWAYKTHHERYERIATEVEKQLREQLRDQWHSLLRTSGELSEDILARINEELTARDSELLEVEVAIERLGEVGDDDKETLRMRKELWERRDRLRVDLKDLAKLLHESGVMGGIATEKLQLLTGQPTQLVEHSFPELQRALDAKGIRLVVGQGSAAPLPPKPVPALPAAADG
jgi:hypothetical protein